MTLLHAYGYACIVSTEISIVVGSRFISLLNRLVYEKHDVLFTQRRIT